MDINQKEFETWSGETSATTMQIAILKAIAEGENIATLFMMAAKALSITSDNSAFFNQAQADLIAMYAYGLSDPSVVKLEVENVEYRLERLKKLIKEAPEAEASRMQRAVAAHEKLLAQLKAQETE